MVRALAKPPAAADPESEAQAPPNWRRFRFIVRRYFPSLETCSAELGLLFVLLPIAGSLVSLVAAFCTKLARDVAFLRRSLSLFLTFARSAIAMLILESGLQVFVSNTVSSHICARVVDALGRRFYGHMPRPNLRYRHATPVGERIYRCDTDVIDTAELLGMALPLTVQYGWQFVVTVIAMCVVDWRPIIVAAR